MPLSIISDRLFVTLHDGLGSVRLTLDDAGVPVDPSGYSYTPFGIPQSGAQPETFGFAGEQWDADTGLVYLRARWYDPASGTFLGRDPFEGFPDMPVQPASVSVRL
ncbi:RHS repeat-associated core domain-containing protein [bacterium]|nr:RHS repeat-associated core domain-containing protein [bacterium]